MDDVVSEAASALIPVVKQFVHHIDLVGNFWKLVYVAISRNFFVKLQHELIFWKFREINLCSNFTIFFSNYILFKGLWILFNIFFLILKVPLSELLWNCLTDLDDLTGSTQSTLKLLSEILKIDNIMDSDKCNSQMALQELIPRLYPFLHHSSSGVRKASLQTLASLVSRWDRKFKKTREMKWINFTEFFFWIFHFRKIFQKKNNFVKLI